MSGDRLRLLLVDDDPPVRRSIARLLAERFVVDQVASGGEALSLIAEALYDAVVCDVVMPAMNGLELYERIRVAQPQLAGRFVFVTGGVPSPELATRIEQTRCPVLQKPFSPGSLVSELERLIGAHGLG